MTIFTTQRLALRLAGPALAGLAVLCAGFAFADAPATTTASDLPFRCGVTAEARGGMTALSALVETDAALSGTYRLAVTSQSNGGRSQVNQGGPFSLATAGSTTLGTVTIAQNATADIVFELDIAGTTYNCAPTHA